MKRVAIGSALAAIVLVGAALSRGWADGIAGDPLYYSGVLEDDGAPAEGARNFEVELWDDPSDTDESHRVCGTRADDVPVERGRFRIVLDGACATAVHAHPDVWVEIRVGGESLGRSKVGAVPYAVESARAADASGALRERLDTMVPPGTVVAFAGGRPAAGWLLCDGREVSRADYPALFEAIGTAHGAGDGATTFRLPDSRGRFLRGVDGDASRDPDAEARQAPSAGGNDGDDVGSVQDFATALPRAALTAQSSGGHTHPLSQPDIRWSVDQGSGIVHAQFGSDVVQVETDAAGEHTHTIDGGDSETRPQNVAVHFVIRY